MGTFVRGSSVISMQAARLTLISSITRVLSTSRGVVSAAATAPAAEPHRAASCAYSLRWSGRRFETERFRNSYSGNCIDVKGIYDMFIRQASEGGRQERMRTTYFSHDGDTKTTIKSSYSL